MAGTNNFLPFCPTDTGTNLLTQGDYAVAPDRTNGNQPGIASSKLVNKATRQATFITSQLAQYLANKLNQNVLDDADTAALQALMVSAFAPADSYCIENLSIATAVGSSALTISVKTMSGGNASAAEPIFVGMRSATLTNGTFNRRTITGALNLVISSGSTLGQVSGMAARIFVYLIDNAGTLELAASLNRFSENALVSTTAEGGAGGADSATVMYSTTARSNVPCRLIGYIDNTQATAGTWASAGTQLQLQPIEELAPGDYVYNAYYVSSQTNFWQRTSAAYGDFTVTGTIPNPTLIKNSNFGTVSKAASSLPGISFIAPRTGRIRVTFTVAILPGQVAGAQSGSVRLVDTNSGANLGYGSVTATKNDVTNGIWPVTVIGYLDATFGVSYDLKLQGAIGSATIYLGAANTETCLNMVMEYIT